MAHQMARITEKVYLEKDTNNILLVLGQLASRADALMGVSSIFSVVAHVSDVSAKL